MKRGTSSKRIKLKGVHKMGDKCQVFPDGREIHFEEAAGIAFEFQIKISTSLKKSDPEMWELTRAEHIDRERQKAFCAAQDKKISQDIAGYKNLKEAFELFDEDGSGCLEEAEVLKILTRAGGGNAMSEDDAKKFIAVFDHNKDGKMQYTEFIEAMKSIAESSGLWVGNECAADEVIEALVEDHGLYIVTRMDDEQLEKLEAAKEKVRLKKGAGVGAKAGAAKEAKEAKAAAKAAAADAAGEPAEPKFECPIPGLQPLMDNLGIEEYLKEATEWLVEVGLETLAELKEMEMEEDLVSFLVGNDLPDAKAKLMLKRIREMPS